MGKLYSMFIFILIAISNINAVTYYIDQKDGNNLNSGLNTSSAWKTISKVNSVTFLPGDYILFKSEQIWREQLNIVSSGTILLPITVSSYGTGAKPIISGADLLSGFVNHSGNIWKKSITSPQQVFFNNIRGKKKTSLSGLTSAGDWYWSSGYLYVYSSANPSGVEAAVRNYSIYVNKKFITIRDIQIEKTANHGITLAGTSEWITVDNVTFYQWTNAENSVRAGISIEGKNNIVKNSVFGKNTGNDIADQNWAGFLSIFISGTNIEVANNKIYHSSTENENGNGAYAYGMNVYSASGITKIYGNYIYHTGGTGIYIPADTRSGDIIHVYENTIEYPGQAGISAYKTRSVDGVGGKGYIYKNHISYANRLGGDIGGNGTQASGIHFNDGVKAGLEAGKPYMKWYCYENRVHNSQALKVPNSPDSGGISMDFNANGVEVYRNITYNNYGKGIYIWNANSCKIYYNIIYGNDTGTTVTATRNSTETAQNNLIYNNTYYKNYNGDTKGPNYNTEVYFGGSGNYNIIKNNILYASNYGYAYLFGSIEGIGCVADYNLVYTEGTFIGWDGYNGKQTFSQWRGNHSVWDKNSVNANPLLNNSGSFDFTLKSGSPAINKGASLGLSVDYLGKTISGSPDIGALEYTTSTTVIDNTPPVLQSASLLNSNSLKIIFSEQVKDAEAITAANYKISGVTVSSASIASNKTEVTLTTSAHAAGSYTVTVSNVKDLAGNTISSSGNSKTYEFTTETIPGNSNIIQLSAENGSLANGAALKIKAGSIGAKVAYCSSTSSTIKFTVNVPSTGTWYVWGRLHYESTSTQNSFFIQVDNGTKYALGNDDYKFNQWHWDGYVGKAQSLGTISAGIHTITIWGREPSATVMIDQLILTNQADYNPDNNPNTNATEVQLAAESGLLSNGAALKVQSGSLGSKVAYCTSTSSTIKFTVNVPSTGNLYAWGRMFYENNSQNSFYIQVDNGSKFILGNDDSKLNQWHWDGWVGKGINLGNLSAGSHTITIWGREPNTTVMIDQLILTSQADYNPNLNTNTTLAGIRVAAEDGILSSGAALKGQSGSLGSKVAYCTSTSSTIKFTINVSSAGTWYAWGRMFYENNSQNSFYIQVDNGSKFILGNNDIKLNQWHWDGWVGKGINLGNLSAGSHTITIWGREPNTTVMIDQLILTSQSNFIPTDTKPLPKQFDIQEEESQPISYDLKQNYPNPFNPSTTIRFSTPEHSFVSLKVYDILGNEVVNLIDEVMPAGNHEIKFNAASGRLSSGIYLYRLMTNNFTQTRKMQIIK